MKDIKQDERISMKTRYEYFPTRFFHQCLKNPKCTVNLMLETINQRLGTLKNLNSVD